MNRLLARSHPPTAALVALALAAIAFTVGGVDHARLFHRGYAQVDVVGPLFLLNALGTLGVVLALLAGRVRLFVVGVLVVSLGSVAAILVSHSSSFFGFSEGGWDADATLILVAEIASVALVLAAGALGALQDRVIAPRRTGPVRRSLAAAAILVLGGASAGLGTGGAPPGDPAPSTAQLAASRAAIAAGGTLVRRGQGIFEAQHCGGCHALAAVGADGRLGPRLDAQHDPVRGIAGNITDPRADIAPGFEAKLMPTDYASRLSAAQVRALSTFIEAASTRGG